jgi:hypothetical protein
VGRRIVAVAIVVASACTALHYSTTSQSSVTIANNPYSFAGPGSATFVISAQGSGAHDVLQSISIPSCSSQWTLDTSIDAQQPVMGAYVCSTGSGSGSTALGEEAIACPRNYQFSVTFAGTLPGTSTCNVSITAMPYGGGLLQNYTLMLSGNGSGGSGISVTPADVNFGEQQINMISSPLVVDVKNNGSASVTVTGSLSQGPFQVTPLPSTPVTIAGGATQKYSVTCMPSQVGKHAGTLTFTGGNSMGSSSLSCVGINSTITIAPSLVTFANTLVGRPPPNRTVTIGGNPSAVIDDISLDAAATAAGVTLVSNPMGMAVGSGQDVVLAYAAEASHPAGPLGTMSVKVSTDGSPRSVSISGQALLGGVGTNPASVELGAVCAGASAMESIEVYASEPGDVVIQAVIPPAPPFGSTVLEQLPRTLSGNHAGPSVNVRVTMTPTSPGELGDEIALMTDVPGKEVIKLQISGIGLDSGIAATPEVVHFGATAPGTTTGIKKVQLTNCGTSPLMFTRATITGTDATEFTLIGANPPRTLPPTESEVFMVVMQPKSAGFKTAKLVMEHGEGSTFADLDGTGDGDLAGGKDRETYYACRAGHGAGLGPIALALLALFRRRR